MKWCWAIGSGCGDSEATRNIVGQSITLQGEKYTVVGVMPSGFRFAPFWDHAGGDMGAARHWGIARRAATETA